jgi:mannosyltransferase
VEAAEALGRGNLSTYFEAIRELVRARSRAFWIVAGLTAMAAALRFATLGVQAYHHDEVVTASRVLRDGFGHAMEAVGFSESAPPLYYALAWLWTQVVGTGEVGLRSVSALAGVATVPVAYLLGAELSKTPSAVPYPDDMRERNSGASRTGLVAAALVAVNPMLLWYSQEARGYALLVLLTALAALYFVRALERGRRADFVGWGIASALALATHYFAIFPIAFEAAWLLRRHGRSVLAGLWIPLLTGLALLPLMLHQLSLGHAEWIGDHSLGHRLWDAGVTFAVGESGEIISRPETALPAAVPVLVALAALALLAARGDRVERRAGGRMLTLAAATVLAPLALALFVPGKDYVIARNLLPALVPLLVAVAIGATAPAARRPGAALAAVLVAYSLGFCVLASVSPAWQRPDWGAVAARLGEPTAPRAMVLWTLGEASLRWYLSTGSIQVLPGDGYAWSVHEVDFISDGPAPPVAKDLLGPRFRQVAYERVGRLYVRRYALPGPDLARLRLRRVRGADLNFHSNGVLLDGIGIS